MLREKIFQMFILGSGNLDIAVKEGVGGVIFFADDITSEEQFKKRILELKTNAKTPLFLSIDQEGGRVERTTNIRPRQYLSALHAFEKGEEFLAKQTENIAKELLYYGLNMNFAPCIDVNSNPNNPIIADRAFANNPNDVCKGFDITFPIYNTNGIVPVVKHFPGHGDTLTDSHKELPILTHDMGTMENIHIKPFKHAIKKGVDAIMVAHLHCTCFDNEEIPTSLSVNCIKYLRNNLKYNGVLISDDMFMNGVAKYGLTEACLKGIEAGLDMFIYRESSKNVMNMIDEIVKVVQNDDNLIKNIEKSYNRIISLKHKYNIIKKAALGS